MMPKTEQKTESTYNPMADQFHKDYPKQDVIAYVATHRDELAEEFYVWLGKQKIAMELRDALLLWEEERFRRRLEPAADCMLLFVVERMRAEDKRGIPDKHWPTIAQRGYAEAEAYIGGSKDETALERVDRIARAAGLLGKGARGGVRSFPELKPHEKAAVAAEQELAWLPYKEPAERDEAYPADAPDAEKEPGDAFEATDDDVDWLTPPGE